MMVEENNYRKTRILFDPTVALCSSCLPFMGLIRGTSAWSLHVVVGAWFHCGCLPVGVSVNLLTFADWIPSETKRFSLS